MLTKKWDGWSSYTGNLKWLPERTIFMTLHGSHAYGTSTPTSDLDIRGIAIAPSEYYLGFDMVFEQAIQKEPDFTVFELQKFFRLASDCNPNALELLYTEESDHLQIGPLGQTLLDNRDLFLSRKAKHTFSGYAFQQLRRINGHQRWLKNPPKCAPTREQFGLPERPIIPKDQLSAAESMIKQKLDEWSWHELDDLDDAQRIAVKEGYHRKLSEIIKGDGLYLAAARGLQFSDNFIELLQREKAYRTEAQNYASYLTWLKERNPVRATLEAKYGFDCKHALHLVRLYLMCAEVLRGEGLKVKRPDAEFLLSIRDGAWTLEQLLTWAEEQEALLVKLETVSPLPKTPNRTKLNALCVSLLEAGLG